MPRTARVAPKEHIYHIQTRGNNRQDVFNDKEDNKRYLDILLRGQDIGSSLEISYGVFMARVLRIEYPDAVYHVTSRGNARNKIFADYQDRENVLTALGVVVKRYNWLCHAYCLMDNHGP